MAAGDVGVAEGVFGVVDPGVGCSRIEFYAEGLRGRSNGKVSVVVKPALCPMLV